MKNQHTLYIDLDGTTWDIQELDLKERRLLADLRKHAQTCQKAHGDPMQRWCDFDNYRLPRILALYEPRGLTRKQIIRTAVYQIGQDLSGRLGIALGLVRQPDYRDYLEDLIEKHFKTRREFCKATGLSEDMLSHVLAGRKDLSMAALSKALDRIGFTINFKPREPILTKSA
jgi:hypothetical protein